MYGVVPIGAFGVEACDEEAVGFYHDLGVGGLHGEEEVVVVVVAGDACEFEGAFAHAEGGIAVAVHDAVGEGAVVGSDAHGAVEIFAEEDEGCEFLADAVEFLFVLGVCVFADFEFFLIGVVAGVDANFFDPFGGFEGGVGFEVDVGDEGCFAACGADFAGNVFEVGGVDFGLCGDADDFAAGVGEL